MRRHLIVGAVALLPLVAAPEPARAADSTTVLGLTFAATLAGTALGAFLFPVVVPAAAPAVAVGYGAVATGVTQAASAVGTLILLEPRMTGAVIGMAAGLAGGLYAFGN